MIRTDEDALKCDLAETYGIFDYRQLPATTVAVFSCGLKDDSRIQMVLNNQHVSLDRIILMTISDRLALLLWSKTKDGQNGRNKPPLWSSIFNDSKENTTFNSGEEFEKEREKLLKEG